MVPALEANHPFTWLDSLGLCGRKGRVRGSPGGGGGKENENDLPQPPHSY